MGRAAVSAAAIARCAGIVCLGAYVMTGATALSAGTPDDDATRASRTVWSGIYTESQAKRGEDLYGRHCAGCHAQDLSGATSYDPSPPLIGRPFHLTWNGKSVGDLFLSVRGTMPKNKPHTLKPNEYADILAFIFRENEFPAGSADLSSDADSLRQIEFTLRD
jgi:cytochrome c